MINFNCLHDEELKKGIWHILLYVKLSLRIENNFTLYGEINHLSTLFVNNTSPSIIILNNF